MAGVVIFEKIESLRRCVCRIEQKRAESPETLAVDIDRQDILALNISRAVQWCVDMAAHVLARQEQLAPATMSESFESLERLKMIDTALCRDLKAAVGFRNVAVHNDRAIDWDIVHAISWQHLHVFSDFARAMLRLADADSAH